MAWYRRRDLCEAMKAGAWKRAAAFAAACLLMLCFRVPAKAGALRGYDAEEGYIYVLFGRYPQRIDGGVPDDGRQAWQWRAAHQKFYQDKANRGKTYDPGDLAPDPILWRVLAADSEKTFLCSEFILFAAPLDTDRKAYRKNGSDFGQTELCARLNGEFAQTAFTEGELSLMLPRETFGNIFLLSAEEMDDKTLGFGTKQARKTWATEYAIRVTGAFVYQVKMGNHSPCWTRTQCKTKPNAGRCTKQEGTIGYYDCTNPEEGVRPCVWLDPEGYRIESGSGTREDPYVILPAAEGEEQIP
ncbi:MAG: hypothetical protein IKQ45_01165 [Clostridia bacterium]|nr:hypothetical protein [Clostridia bacterium]